MQKALQPAQQPYLSVLALQGGQRTLECLDLPWALEAQGFQGNQDFQSHLGPTMAREVQEVPGGLGGLGIKIRTGKAEVQVSSKWLLLKA